MSIVRNILTIYRKIQYRIYGRLECGSMTKGDICTHTPYDDEVNHGDVVHPCVRYIPEGYLGHKWWMVYTPYYSSNEAIENPILCYSDVESTIPPTHWIVAYQVQEKPNFGYNSDPTLFYDNGKMYVMWRENLTERCHKYGYVRATFGAEVLKSGIGPVFGPLVGTESFEDDSEVSPTFLKGDDGKYRCYAMHIRFHVSWYRTAPNFIKKIVAYSSNFFDIIGLWSQQKGYGYAIWESDDIKKEFQYKKTLKFKNCNKLYRPWHMDLFEADDRLYAIVQTNQCNADIVLAESVDGVNFRIAQKPLMTNITSELVGLYKPTGGVVGDRFYLYYTAQRPIDRKLNNLYLSVCPKESCLV